MLFICGGQVSTVWWVFHAGRDRGTGSKLNHTDKETRREGATPLMRSEKISGWFLFFFVRCWDRWFWAPLSRFFFTLFASAAGLSRWSSFPASQFPVAECVRDCASAPEGLRAKTKLAIVHWPLCVKTCQCGRPGPSFSRSTFRGRFSCVFFRTLSSSH